jgi:cobalt/nickel transport system permease protein
MPPLAFPLAVHISDGVLSAPWLIGGALLAGVLMLLAMYRVRDEEIPRIALLTAAFFVASLIHVRLGPTSVHLLLNGLVGVMLGWRAALAIPVGLALQAILLMHGGFSSLGVNCCIMTLPALGAGALYALLHRLTRLREFVLGLVIGALAVLATLILNALTLLWGGAEDWQQIVTLVFIAHLPLVVLEGVVVGFTVSFVARVKPEMLNREQVHEMEPVPPCSAAEATPEFDDSPLRQTSVKSSTLLVVLLALAFSTSPVQAHRLDADYRVLPGQRIEIESWFSTQESPPNATVTVKRGDGQVLVQGKLNEKGLFVFRYEQADTLTVVVSAGAGHRTEVRIPREKLEGGAQNEAIALPEIGVRTNSEALEPFADRRTLDELKNGVIGVGVLLAVAAFVLSLRNALKLRELKQRLEVISQQPADQAPSEGRLTATSSAIRQK